MKKIVFVFATIALLVATSCKKEEEPVLDGALNGLFSVSASKQVRFAQGNLQYQASTNTWRFAEQQYGIVGNLNAQISATCDGWIDLFCWATSGYHDANDTNNVNYYPYCTANGKVNTTCNWYGYGPSTNMKYPDLTGNSANYDWGVYNAISNGGNKAGLWRTLGQSEWEYLLFVRADAAKKYALGRIQLEAESYQNGVVLLPDSWELPEGCTFNPGADTVESYAMNTYSVSQWNAMSKAGAVFLPSAGFRMITMFVPGSDAFGYYWTSTHKDSRNSVYLGFGLKSIGIDSYYRAVGYSVRLVNDNE